MKLAFFLITFFLVLCRLYYKSIWPELWDQHRTTVTISSGDDYESIRYKGYIELTEDETGIGAMHGYIHYEHNDIKLRAEGDDNGHVTYEIRNDGRRLDTVGEGREVIREALREMINYGFDARQRMYRVYERGGDSALQRELGRLKASWLLDNYKKLIQSHQMADTLREEN